MTEKQQIAMMGCTFEELNARAEKAQKDDCREGERGGLKVAMAILSDAQAELERLRWASMAWDITNNMEISQRVRQLMNAAKYLIQKDAYPDRK